MRKIIFLLVIFCVAFMTLQSAYTDTIVSSGISSTYKRLMFVQFDSLTTTLKPIWMGNQAVSPLEISTTQLSLNDANELHFRDDATYLYSADSNDLSVVAAADLTLSATNLYLGSASNHIKSNTLTLAANLICVNATASGDLAVTDDVTADSVYVRTLEVTETTTLTGNVTSSGTITGNVTGNLAGNVTASSGTSTFTAITSTGTGTFPTVVCTTATISGNSTVAGTQLVTGVLTNTDGIVANGYITSDKVDEISGSGNGVTVDGLLLIDGDIQLNNDNYISFDDDDNSRIFSDTADEIDVNIGGATDFTFSANVLTAISGSSILSNTISETTSETGVTLDGCLMEEKESIYNFYSPSGKYVAFTASDVAESTDPSSHGLTDSDDLYIAGIFEVDGYTYLDGLVTCASTVTTAGLSFSGNNPEVSPTAQESADGKNFIIHGGDGSANGGDLFLDGGAATTDGDVLLGDRDGNVSINSALLFPEGKELTCDGDGIPANITETINYINATKADTITVADGVEGQTICFVTMTNSTAFSIAIQPASCGWDTETVLDSKTSACELIFHTSNWYIKSITD